MTTYHKDLKGTWASYSIFSQMANIGADVGRAMNWKKKGNSLHSQNAFYRALELIDLSVEDKRNYNRLGELLRMREMLVDYIMGNNMYRSTESLWNSYFLRYAVAARNK